MGSRAAPEMRLLNVNNGRGAAKAGKPEKLLISHTCSQLPCLRATRAENMNQKADFSAQNAGSCACSWYKNSSLAAQHSASQRDSGRRRGAAGWALPLICAVGHGLGSAGGGTAVTEGWLQLRQAECAEGFLSWAGCFLLWSRAFCVVLVLFFFFIVSANREVRNLMSCSSAPCWKPGCD